jgi:hypothetical protein
VTFFSSTNILGLGQDQVYWSRKKRSHDELSSEELEKDIGDLETRSGFGERKTEESDFWEFGWIKDGEGKRLELWRLPEGM